MSLIKKLTRTNGQELKKYDSSRQIVITDNSIVICLVLTAVLIAAGLILARTAVIGEAGSLYANSIQPYVIRFKIDSPSAQKLESGPAAAEEKPDGQQSAALSPLSPEPEAVNVAPAPPIAAKEEPAAARLPKGDDPAKPDSQPPSNVSEPGAVATDIFLMTIRGRRHRQYASIMFECSGPIDYSRPRIEGAEIRFKIRNIKTRLRSYRKYRTFDSWVRLDETDSDLEVSIGVLPNLVKFSDLLLEDPPRLIINLYDE